MDDWQGCLAPDCQAALVRAKEGVQVRGGTVVTVEDFLLALLDICPDISRFLRSRGIDLDELVRTVQCEQPIVTEVGGQGGLSSELVAWLARTRELIEEPWLTWGQLLKVLTTGMERLREKAYVAVLELVSQWPGDSAGDVPLILEHRASAPVVVTSNAWMDLAEDVAVAVSASGRALVWLQSPSGTGKSCWLPIMLAALSRDYLELDLRREMEVLASDLPVFSQRQAGASSSWPLLVLDHLSPAELVFLMARPGSLASELVINWQGPILLLSEECGKDDCHALESLLGRKLRAFRLPLADVAQREAILTAHQASIERRWNVEIPVAVISFAAKYRPDAVATLGALLEWVERAAARLDLWARCGPLRGLALAGAADTLHRQNLVAMARAEMPEPAIAEVLADIARQQRELEQPWHQRKAEGTLRRLTVADLLGELQRSLAADTGPVHYVQQHNQQDGDSAGAGSGNIHP